MEGMASGILQLEFIAFETELRAEDYVIRIVSNPKLGRDTEGSNPNPGATMLRPKHSDAGRRNHILQKG